MSKLSCDLKHHFHTDGGHGWLKVPVARLKKLGIEKEITGYSYLKGKNAYLEEDCDLSTYIKALKKQDGLDPEDDISHASRVWLETFWNNCVTHDTSDTRRSVIRTYDNYCVISDEQRKVLEQIRERMLSLKNWGRGTTGEYIRSLRCSRDMLLREVASELNIDQSLLSNIERDERQATRDQIMQLSNLFNVENDSLLISWLSDKVLKNLDADRNMLERVMTEVKRRIE